MKVVDIGAFIQVIYDDDRIFGGFVSTLSTDSPKVDEHQNSIYILGLSTSPKDRGADEKILWAHKIKQFRIIHK